MTDFTAYHQLGRFIVEFQSIEALLNEVLALISNSDHEAVYILANDLEYSRRLKTADVLFARFVGLRAVGDVSIQKEFHDVMVELRKLGERRNELVHSRYYDWHDIHGSTGLLRTNSTLRAKEGKRDETLEELLPDTFNADLEVLLRTGDRLEALRLRAIDWLYPQESEISSSHFS